MLRSNASLFLFLFDLYQNIEQFYHKRRRKANGYKGAYDPDLGATIPDTAAQTQGYES